jgi:hypothetical protein
MASAASQQASAKASHSSYLAPFWGESAVMT